MLPITPPKNVQPSCPDTPRKVRKGKGKGYRKVRKVRKDPFLAKIAKIVRDISTPLINDALLEAGLEPIGSSRFTPTNNINIIDSCFTTPTKDNNVEPVCPPRPVRKYESPFQSYNNYTDCNAPSKKRILKDGKSSAFDEVNNK